MLSLFRWLRAVCASISPTRACLTRIASHQIHVVPISSAEPVFPDFETSYALLQFLNCRQKSDETSITLEAGNGLKSETGCLELFCLPDFKVNHEIPTVSDFCCTGDYIYLRTRHGGQPGRSRIRSRPNAPATAGRPLWVQQTKSGNPAS